MHKQFSPTGTIIDGKERQAFPLSSEKFQHSSQDGAPTLSLTSSDANEEGSFSEAEKVSSVQSEESKSQHDTVPILVLKSGNHIFCLLVLLLQIVYIYIMNSTCLNPRYTFF